MTAQPIGGAVTPLAFTIKQGGSGKVRIARTATKPDGSALDSYDGWTAALVLTRAQSSTPELTMMPTVTGDPDTMRFLIDLDFATNVTKTTRAGDLAGDLVLIDPDGERHYQADVTLTIERSYAPAATP